MPGFDEEQIGRGSAGGTSGTSRETQPCETCHGQRLNPRSRCTCASASARSPSWPRAPVAASGEFFAQPAPQPARARDRARPPGRDPRAPASSSSASASATCSSIAPRRRSRAARRSASVSPRSSARTCRACATCSTSPPSACTRATTRSCSIRSTELAEARNTLVVVEHDEETIRRADHVLDLGPGAGVRGGEVVAAGTVARPRCATRARSPGASCASRCCTRRSRSARCSRARRAPDARARRAAQPARTATCSIPLGRLVVVTGVSGSGKSTVARDVLYANLQAPAGRAGAGGGARARRRAAHRLRRAHGLEHVERVLEVDQTPIGKTPRSCPATYIGFWDEIRRIFADTTEARIRGYTASRFSFNTAGGRCEACEGQGVKTIEMSFLPDVKVLCDVCGGAALQRRDAQRSLWRDKSIGDVLAMNVDDAVGFFAAHPRVHHALQAAAGRRPRLPHARPAEPDALGRRGAAHQAGDRAVEGARRGAARPAPEAQAHPVRARRADRRPAHGRRREADPRAAPPGGRRQHGGGGRAQPRRHGRGRLDHRPRARRPATAAAASSPRAPRPRSRATAASRTPGACWRSSCARARAPPRPDPRPRT